MLVTSAPKALYVAEGDHNAKRFVAGRTPTRGAALPPEQEGYPPYRKARRRREIF